MSPHEFVMERYELPFELYPFQVEWLNKLAPLPRTGHYAQVGTGKTPVSTVSGLYKMEINHARVIVLMPPILLTSWGRWLQRVKRRATGESVSMTIYRGTPPERTRLSLDVDFVLMSIGVFKRDHAYLMQQYEGVAVVLIVDEATSIKNIESQNYKRVRDFSAGRELLLLTGTPLSTPADAYAYVKLVAPEIYRNQNHFEALHVGARDFFGNVSRWENLEFLAENMKINSVRILKEEVLQNLPPITYQPIPYALDAEHQKLYERLAEEQLLLTEQGGKIDATTAPKLYQALQQIVLNPAHFSGDPMMRSAGYALIDEVVEELDLKTARPNGKLLIFANYKMTIRALVEYLKAYGVVAWFGEVSAKQQQKNLDRFVLDADCRVGVAHPLSAGYGLNLQEVCADVFFAETPIIPKDFEQSVGRVYRDGQPKAVAVRIGIAEKTVQVRLHSNLLVKDAVINRVQGGWKDLREAIYGIS